MAKFFPRQELAARGFSPTTIAALERAYRLSEEQADQIADVSDRVSAQEAAPVGISHAEVAALESDLLRLIGLLPPGPTHADIAALQAQLEDLKVQVRPRIPDPEPAQDLMYPPSYS